MAARLFAHAPRTPLAAVRRCSIRSRPGRWLALLLLLAAGCHADLDWRELRSEEGRFSVWFPARPFEQSRALAGRHEGVPMRQWSATARDTVFAAGYADFAPLTQQTIDEVRAALVMNISGKVLNERGVTIAGAQGREFFAAGHAGDAQLSLRLRLIPKGDRLYEIAVLGTPGAVSGSDIDTFFDSFRLLAVGG